MLDILCSNNGLSFNETASEHITSFKVTRSHPNRPNKPPQAKSLNNISPLAQLLLHKYRAFKEAVYITSYVQAGYTNSYNRLV